jgi:hypothetical protein
MRRGKQMGTYLIRMKVLRNQTMMRMLMTMMSTELNISPEAAIGSSLACPGAGIAPCD